MNKVATILLQIANALDESGHSSEAGHLDKVAKKVLQSKTAQAMPNDLVFTREDVREPTREEAYKVPFGVYHGKEQGRFLDRREQGLELPQPGEEQEGETSKLKIDKGDLSGVEVTTFGSDNIAMKIGSPDWLHDLGAGYIVHTLAESYAKKQGTTPEGFAPAPANIVLFINTDPNSVEDMESWPSTQDGIIAEIYKYLKEDKSVDFQYQDSYRDEERWVDEASEEVYVIQDVSIQGDYVRVLYASITQ